jgi:hypothetical protein
MMLQKVFEHAVEEAHETTTCKGLRLAGIDMRISPVFQDCNCSHCKKSMNFNQLVFRDALSVKEFFVSGWCQACQDRLFKPFKE